MLLVATALAAAGTGLAFRARAGEPGPDGGPEIQRLIDVKREELRRLIAEQQEYLDGRRVEATEGHHPRQAGPIRQDSPTIKRRQGDVFSIAAPRPGSRMEILVSTPGGVSGRYIPQLVDQDRLQVKVEARGKGWSRVFEV